MAGRICQIEEKVQPVLIALDQINVKAAAREAGIPPSTLRDDLKKVQKALPEVLADRKRGPTPKNRAKNTMAKRSETEEPRVCTECSGKVTKNGTYCVLNWVLMLTMGWMGVQKVLIQRRRCKKCGKEIASPERVRQAEARQAWWQQANRLIVLSRFKLRLSVRLRLWKYPTRVIRDMRTSSQIYEFGDYPILKNRLRPLTDSFYY